jgi:hypothetical protein
MQKKILYAFLIVMLIINIVLLYLIIDKRMRKGPSKGQTFLTEQLDFSETQKEEFLKLDEIHREKMMRLDDELKSVREVLFQSFDKKADFTDMFIERMGEIEVEKLNELFSFFKEVRTLCNEDQVKKFDQIIQEVLHRRGPKGPKGKPDRLPPPPPN